ncbi:cyclodeaminase/cyclohydrolase family protein [Oxyplasma meridianum]|uniref:Cyclodeaminase/cyclohydrolase family protein n=1 Tax=Oxyplasma meridianum TaxID=3073602 RepID=A0AAX4NJF4_9ARCH
METLDSFMERLSSPSPTPGGGAASALVSVTAASLVSMVASLTKAKKAYAAYREEMESIESRSIAVKKDLIELMKEDEEAFNLIVKAWGMDKSTEENARMRKVEIEKASKIAIMVPWKIARASYLIMEMAEVITRHGIKSAVTDSACAGIFAESAIKGVLYNVAINLKSIEDEVYREMEEIKMKLFLQNASEILKRIETITSKIINPEVRKQ